MTLQEILRMISLKCQHSYGDSDIIAMINDIQKRIFRTMYKPKTASTYDVLTDNPFYPISFSPDNIIDVVVDGKEYPYQNIKYDAQSYYYYVSEIEEGICIGIYPTPKTDVARGLTVFHYKEPREVVDTDDIPELDPVWHMMLVYHVCKELATIDPAKNNWVNSFIAEINELEKQFNRSKQARPHRIQDVYGVGRGAL